MVRKSLIIVAALCVAIPVVAQVAGFKVNWVDYFPQASNPVGAGRSGTYFKSDGTFHTVNSSGTDTAVGSGSGTVTNVATGTGLTGGPITTTGTVSLANQIAASTCTNCNLTYNAQGQITVAANGSGGGVTNLQQAYEGGNTIAVTTPEGTIAITAPPDMGVVSVTQNGCVMVANDTDLGTFKENDNCGGITLENTTAATSTAFTGSRPSPPIRLWGTAWDSDIGGGASRVDKINIYNWPLDNGSDTLRMVFAHEEVGITGAAAGPHNFFNILGQGNVGGGELILNTDWPNLCAYMGPTDTPGARADKAFWCLNGISWKQGPSLGSTNRWGVAVGGLAPDNNNTMNLGGAATQFADVFAVQHTSIRDNLGAAAPSSNKSFRMINGQPATNNNQQYSPSTQLAGYGWSEAAGTYKSAIAYFQMQPVQQASAHPTADFAVWSATETGGERLRVVLGSTQGAATGGYIGTQHAEGIGAAPSIAGGAGACTTPTIPAVDGSDLSGNFSVTTGTGCVTGTVATVTYANPYDYKNADSFTAKPRAVLLYAGNANAAAAIAAGNVFWDKANSSTTAFVVTAAIALTDATEYVFSYVVIR